MARRSKLAKQGVRYRNRREDVPNSKRRMGIVFALGLGWCGVHRFILGQWQWGLFHIFLFVVSMSTINSWLNIDVPWLSASALLGYFTAYQWWRMSGEEFADNYLEPVEEHVEGKYLQGTATAHPKVKSGRVRRKILASAKTHYENFDFQGAADLYEDALDLDHYDGESRVFAARCYSLLENSEDAYRHLKKAIQLKASNLELVDEDEGFAWLRLQPDFMARKRSGYGEVAATAEMNADEPKSLPSPEPNILDRLEQLGRLRDRGLLDDEEFAREKRRLLR